MAAALVAVTCRQHATRGKGEDVPLCPSVFLMLHFHVQQRASHPVLRFPEKSVPNPVTGKNSKITTAGFGGWQAFLRRVR